MTSRPLRLRRAAAISRFFRPRSPAATESWNRREIKDYPNLLELSKYVLRTVMLQVHYRSAYRELIAFSNNAFYDGTLNVPVRHPVTEIGRARPIEVVQANVPRRLRCRA